MTSLEKCFNKFKEGVTDFSSKPFFIIGNKMVYRSFQTFSPKDTRENIEKIADQVMTGHAILLDYVKEKYDREEVIRHLHQWEIKVRRYEEEIVAVRKGNYIVWNKDATNFNSTKQHIPKDILRIPFNGLDRLDFFCRDIKEVVADPTIKKVELDILALEGKTEIINHPLIETSHLETLANKGCREILKDKLVFKYVITQTYSWSKKSEPEYYSPLHCLVDHVIEDIKVKELKEVVGITYDFLIQQHGEETLVTREMLDEMINRPNVFKFLFDNNNNKEAIL